MVRPICTGRMDVEISAVTADSRQVVPGVMFVALRGVEDGRKFIADALERGAAAILADVAPDAEVPMSVPWVQVSDPRGAYGAVAAELAGNPARRLKVAGVTGTNGKTTVAFLMHYLMASAWHRAGMVGTVLFHDGVTSVPATHTTPDAEKLQELFRRMVENGCRGVSMEVSSHGIDQKRIAGTAFDVAVFTNLTQDHLDYHGSMEAYTAVKYRWFEEMAIWPTGKKPAAVVNTDDAAGEKLVGLIDGRMPVIRYGFNVHCDFRANNLKQTSRGTEFELTAEGKSYLVRTPLIGRFNVYNALAALAAVTRLKVPLRDAVAAIAHAPQVPGRMELCGVRDGVSVFVDYSHTPDALENACRTLRELQPRRLITVFGCGGDRDKTKRPLMGKAAASLSDVCILTSDNPRSEDPMSILRSIESGMGSARYKVVEDRAEAIRIAVHAAGKGDIVLIAGKGHETYQQFADHSIDFDDRKEARRALEERPSDENPPSKKPR